MVQALKEFDYRRALEDAINEHAYYAEDLITAQLSQGIDGDGNPLPPYSKTSIEFFGKRPGPMTLQDTHDFVNRIIVVAKDGVITEESTDWKDEMLSKAYGSQILKLTDDSKAELMTLVRATFIEKISEKTGLQ